MNDKRNININRGTGEDIESYLGRITEHISKLEWQSEGHRQWYTHKNPYGCWICEILQVGRCLEAELLASTGNTRQEPEPEDLNMDDEYED